MADKTLQLLKDNQQTEILAEVEVAVILVLAE
jgi:hypothetical protein